MEKYTLLTEKHFIDVMKMLSKKEEPRTRQYVFMTGVEGMFMFDLAIQGIKLPKGITYTTTRFSKLKGFLYLNIGKKHDNTKIWINMNKKTYTAMKGTIKIGTYNNIENAVRALKLD